jgi:predicted unusual protein kinase regulating ubiquinone biosynthesis (AarF/ABC1/UbiB family)
MSARDADTDTLTGRVKRYARVGAAMGGLAAQYAGNRVLRLPLDGEKPAAELSAALGRLKGPLMKVAQLVSTIPDALPEEYVKELVRLQADAPSMGWPFVKRRMTAELGPDWRSRFESFEHEAAAAASLGQVHRAVARDGRTLACKLQYSDMASVVEADLRQLKLVFAIYRRYDPAIDTSEIHREISARLREEVDYDREARHIALYRHMLRRERGIHVPETLPELCTDRLLTMTWLDGRRLLTFRDSDPEHRNRVAANMFRAWYAPLYSYGVLHGDPHLGNYSVREDLSINLLDFGCIRVFKPELVGGVINLYYALLNGDTDRAVSAYETWGFEGLTREVIEVLNMWAQFVYAPLMEDRAQPMQDTNSVAYGAETAARVHRELRRLGGVRPPREFLLMDRAAIGLGSVFLHLRAEINWYRLFHDLIDDFDLARLTRRQAKALDQAGLARP